MEYKPLYSIESQGGSYGWYGIRIEVAARKLPDLEQEAIQRATYDAVAKIEFALLASALATDEAAQEQRRVERAELVALFAEPIFVEEIPNGYCSKYCCAHLPWFVVTTRVGRFKVGWRKRVINIDWTDTLGTKTAEELFPSEDVTKDKRGIHAWSLEKAREYVAKVMNA